jgi:phosphopantothenoylcysteine decarboxylase/phosphopantothenate--cysteine ligase
MNILLGVTGSVSAYKSVELMRLFQKNNHAVTVILTHNATEFICPLTFDVFAPGKVYEQMFKPNQDPVLHIHLAEAHDILLVAPASANIIGKFAGGIGDDLLSTTFLAFFKPVILAPAMNPHMYANLAVQENLQVLRRRGIQIIEPETGTVACADFGKGRLADIEYIYNQCLGGEHVS